MSGSRRVSNEFTAGAALMAVSAGLFALGVAQWTSTASASVPAIWSEGSSSLARTDTRKVRVVLPSMYQPAALEGAVSPVTVFGSSAPLAQKGDFLGTIVFSAEVVDQTIAFQAVSRRVLAEVV
jgi:hypothetical protein